jgi:hypothetical protein
LSARKLPSQNLSDWADQQRRPAGNLTRIVDELTARPPSSLIPKFVKRLRASPLKLREF